MIATEYTDNSADKDYVPRPQVSSPNIKAGDLDGNGPFKLNTQAESRPHRHLFVEGHLGVRKSSRITKKKNDISVLSVPFLITIMLAQPLFIKKIAKGTTDPRVEFILQVLTQILIKFHLQNLEQVSTSRSQPSMNISTKVKLKDIDQT